MVPETDLSRLSDSELNNQFRSYRSGGYVTSYELECVLDFKTERRRNGKKFNTDSALKSKNSKHFDRLASELRKRRLSEH